MRTRIVVAAVAALALGAGPARADTLTVDQAAGPYTTISDALADANDGDTIEVHPGTYAEQLSVDQDDLTIHGEPGTVVASTAGPDVIALTGDGDRLDGLSVSGGPGGVSVVGDGDDIADATLTASDHALVVDGPVTATVRHTQVRALDPAGTAVYSRNDTPVGPDPGDADQDVQLQTAVVIGGALGTAFDVRTGAPGESGARGETTFALGTTTVALAPTALADGQDGQGGDITFAAFDSIVHGSAPDLLAYRTETAATDAADFVSPATLDLHLRADAPAVGFTGGLATDATAVQLAPARTAADFDGAPRLDPAATASVGAYEFHDTPPTATFTVSPDPERGRPVTLDASSSIDPDAAIGGRVVSYRWQLQDQDVTTDRPVLQHIWKGYNNMAWGVLLTTVDNNGRATQSARVEVTVPDRTPPVLRFSRPADRARLHRYTITTKHHRKHKLIDVLRFSGRVSAGEGIGHVIFTLQRTGPKGKAKKGRPAQCRYYSALGRLLTRACTAPWAFNVPVVKDAWGWHSAQHVPFPPGTWTLTASATDQTGNVGTSVLHFTVT